MWAAGNILVNSPISTFQQGLTHSALMLEVKSQILTLTRDDYAHDDDSDVAFNQNDYGNGDDNDNDNDEDTNALWVKPCWKVEIGEFTSRDVSLPQ